MQLDQDPFRMGPPKDPDEFTDMIRMGDAGTMVGGTPNVRPGVSIADERIQGGIVETTDMMLPEFTTDNEPFSNHPKAKVTGSVGMPSGSPSGSEGDFSM